MTVNMKSSLDTTILFFAVDAKEHKTKAMTRIFFISKFESAKLEKFLIKLVHPLP